MQTAHRNLLLTVMSVTTVLLLAACGGGTGDGEGSVFEELLGTIPDTLETRGFVEFHDYLRFREAFDIRLPGPEADEEALGEYLLRPIGMPQFQGPFISGYGEAGFQAVERRRYLGFDVRNVDQSLLAGSPPGTLEVLRGSFDPDATEEALKACSECDPPRQTEWSGIRLYSWGEDLAVDTNKILAPPAFDRLGRGGRLAVLDDYVFRTVETAGMIQLIDASLGLRDSLADADEFRLLATGLDELNAYSGLLTDETQSLDVALTDLLGGFGGNFTQQEVAQLRATMEAEPLLRPYDAFATGAGKDNRGQYMAVVLVHRSERVDRRNVELLRRRIEEAKSLVTGEPWADFFDDMEIQADGVVLLGKL